MSNLAKLYNMAPSRLHAIYGGESSTHRKEMENNSDMKNLSDMENLSDSPFENKESDDLKDHHFENQEIEDYINGGESKIRHDNVDRLIAMPDEVIMAESTMQQSSEPIADVEPAIQPEIVESIEPIVEAESVIQPAITPEIVAPLFNGGESSTNHNEIPNSQENLADSPELNEVDRLFAKLTGGSQKTPIDSSDYIYELIEPEDLRMWLYDGQSSVAHDDESTKLIRGGDEQSSIAHMKSSPYYSEFQALIDGLI